MSQNIFDNPVFFSSYQELREGANYNDLLEQPAMAALVPDLTGKSVLDIGCGYGRNCLTFSQKAASVTGIDISSRMLNVAMKENCGGNIRYLCMDMEELDRLDGEYDFIYSSLAFHYAENLDKLLSDCHRILKKDGILLFSQEHPIATASINTDYRYVKDEEGNVFFKVADYQKEGVRHVRWFVDDVIHQHRTFSTIVNSLSEAGFIIEKCVEPCPGKKEIRKLPRLRNEIIKPSFIIFKARKGETQCL